MNPQQMERILERINELKALFIFGQRVIPFLEELFGFVQNIVPLMQDMNRSLRESTTKMPRASSQLNDVTRATELATNEILDILDDILFKLGEVQSSLNQATDFHRKINRLERKLDRLLDMDPETMGTPEWIRQAKAVQEEKKTLLKALRKTFTRSLKQINDVKENASNIMFSLQVQDITSQQIAAVNHLIESVQERIEQLLNRLEAPVASPSENEPVSVQPLPFDPQASYTRDDHRQQTADAIFSRSASVENPTFLQEEIDQLFQGNISPDSSPSPASNANREKRSSGNE
ncbi:MAG: protein phosphatase CheZ [Calditrichaeota bacterium]|nr:protein phosphatase CheZ [Calditrichota bacterium]